MLQEAEKKFQNIIQSSKSHFQVGSVVAVGSIKSGEGIDWRIFRNIAISWIVTLPVSGTVYLFYGVTYQRTKGFLGKMPKFKKKIFFGRKRKISG